MRGWNLSDILVDTMQNLLAPRPEKLDEDIREYNYPYPVLFRIAIINFLRECFYGAAVGGYKYDPDETKTEVIVKDGAGETSTPGKRPAIMINRSEIVPYDRTMGNNLLFSNFNTGSSQHSDWLITNIIISCFEQNSLLSEYLANIVFSMLRYHKKELNDLGISKIRDFSIGVPQKSGYGDGDTETKITSFRCDVSAQIHLQQSWKMRWKTREEILEYIERTGTDPTTSNVPPQIFKEVDVETNNE